MANKRNPEVRLSQGTVIAIIAMLALTVIFWPNLKAAGNAAFNVVQPEDTAEETAPEETAPEETGDDAVSPLIEKTKVYLSTIDQADYDGEKQKTLVAGTASLIKSGNLLEDVTTTATTGAASTAEFNGGDVITVLGDATSYYANAVEDIEIVETLQPIEVFIRASGTPTVELLDENGDAVSTVALATNDVSDVYTLRVERPGDDSWYQFCGVAADYNDDELEVQFETDGSFNKGTVELVDVHDKFDNAGYEAVWDIDNPVKNYDRVEVDFLFKTKKDINPGAQNVTLTVFDCEQNLQSGDIVYTDEDSSDSDVGLSDIDKVVAVT